MARLYRWAFVLFLVLCAGARAHAQNAPTTPVAAPTPALAWQVENRFRLWDQLAASAPNDVENLLLQVGQSNDPAKIYDALLAFHRSHPRLFKNSHWDATAQQYDLGYLYPSSYTILIGIADPTAFANQSCHWTSSVGTIARPDIPCSGSAEITLPADAPADGRSVQATVAVQTRAGGVLQPLVQQTLQVRDRLIVSLGDSFAAGEGNPDQPSNLASLEPGPGASWVPDWNQRWLGRPAMSGVQGADWWDLPCHRSQFTQHAVAAVKYAADRPHEAVTFVSFACSGASVYNGLVVPQAQPPGYGDKSTTTGVALAQVDALARNLCPPDAAGASTAVPGAARTYHQGGWWGTGLGETTLTAPTFHCSGKAGRPVDVILLSEGGNDIGFSAVIMDAMLPRHAAGPVGEVILAAVRGQLGKTPLQATTAIENDLPGNLRVFDAQLSAVASGALVIQSDYPSPIRGQTGWFCGPADKTAPSAPSDPSAARLVGVNGVWPDRQVAPNRRWAMVIDQKEGASVEPIVVNALNAKIEYHAHVVGWKIANGYLLAFTDHGWCATEGADADGPLPEWASGGWAPWNPASWDPYAHRARFFRTPNDAALTEIQDSPRPNPLLQTLLSINQLALLNSFDGSFHPTFEGHVVMGLGVDATLESVVSP